MTSRPPMRIPAPAAERARLGAYALVVRDGDILLTRLAARVVDEELWTLPGGGVEPGEDPNDTVVREVHEETGLAVTVDERALVRPASVERADGTVAHSVRLVFTGRVPRDAPPPRVVEVDGSTADAAWHAVADVTGGAVPVTRLVDESLAAYAPARLQRLAAYGLAARGTGAGAEILLTRISSLGHHAGRWTLPGGGVDHGESPADAVAREFDEETGLQVSVGAVVDVHDTHFVGTAPHGGSEDYHGVHLVYAVEIDQGDGCADAAPELAGTEAGGTTDLAAWIPVADVVAGRVQALELVHHVIARHGLFGGELP